MPPVAATGVNGVAALPTVRVVLATACVVVNAGFTVRLKVLNDVCAVGVVWSVTVTVKVVAASVVDGVPLIRPLLVEKFKPVGSVPPGSANVSVPAPPDAVTGVNDATLPTVKVVLGKAWVVVSIAVTVRLKVLNEVCAVGVVWSVTVTVKLVVARAVDGVPVIKPVVVEKFKPVGRVPPDSA